MWPRRGPYAYYGAGNTNRYARRTYQEHVLMRLVLPLAHQIYMLEHKPPATIALVVLNLAFFLRPEGLDAFLPTVRNGCLHPSKMLFRGQWARLLWAPFLHADEMHVYYNMASLLWKGAQLEPAYGTGAFLALNAELAAVSGLLYVAAAATLAPRVPYLLGRGIMSQCAVGFSGVLFGLKVILNHNAAGWSSVFGVSLPTKYAAWAELIVIQLITPNASFLGHLCGICAGLIHVHMTRRIVRHGWWHRRSSGGDGRGRRNANGYQHGRREQHRFYGRGTWG
jgi:rhomboid domain-containing protein 1